MEKQPPQGDIRSVIRACYDKMTATEKAIADYFLGDVPIENLSPKTLTARLYVSKATLTRFANRCGFEGYREFVYHYKTGRVQQPGGSSFTQLTRKVIETYQAIFDRTRALIDEDQLERIARMLVCSERVYLYGSGSSGIAARELRLRLMRLGMPVEAIDDYLLMKINASVMQPDATVFLVAYFLVASSAVAMLRKSFSASKIRRMSMPFLMDSSTNFSTTSS